jgi:3-oxoacyl-[acyl-carrier protein] reductase
MEQNLRLRDRVAIVTGGARGIGKHIAGLFAEEGASVVIVSRTDKEVKKTVSEIKKAGGQAIGIVGDVSNAKDVKRMVDKTIASFGTIDILVNNAGVQKPIGRFIDVDMDEWKENVEINLFGTAMCCKAVLPVMLEKKQGKIINFSGGGSTDARAHFTAYGVAKTAIVRFTETLAEELKDLNIQVNAIAPGAVNTYMLQEVLAAGEAAGEKEIEEAETRAEKGGTPPELAAELAFFLASDLSDGLTGRLISALWDDWDKFDEDIINQIMNSDICTLRRISCAGLMWA